MPASREGRGCRWGCCATSGRTGACGWWRPSGSCRPAWGAATALHRIVEVAPWHPAPEMRAVQVPIDPSGKDAMKPLSTPAAVAVREGPDRQPAAVRLGERWRRVARIEDRWCFDLWWLPEPLTRTYYRVSAEDGRQVTLFRDQRGGRWYRQTP